MKIKFKPLHDRVLIKPLDKATHTKSGLQIPEMAQKNPPGGEVIAVGKGNGEPLTVKVGDMVVYHKFSGEEIAFDKETGGLVTVDTPQEQVITYKTMREAEIIAIL